MPGPPYHARTHLPGGSDPLEVNLPWAWAWSTSNQTIDNPAEEASFTNFDTNKPDLFELDTSGTQSGILIYGRGMVATFAKSTTGVTGGAYVQIQPATSYPLFGVEFGDTVGFGPFAMDSSLLPDLADGGRQWHVAIGGVFGEPEAPYRATYALARSGATNFDATGASLVIIRFGDT